MEITEDAEDDEYEYEEVKESDEEKVSGAPESDEDDLDNFDALKAKTTMKQAMQTKGKYSCKDKGFFLLFRFLIFFSQAEKALEHSNLSKSQKLSKETLLSTITSGISCRSLK